MKPKTHTVRVNKGGIVRCRVCRCSEYEPCEPPCGWYEADLCTNCAEITGLLVEWFSSALRPSWAALKREVELCAVSPESGHDTPALAPATDLSGNAR